MDSPKIPSPSPNFQKKKSKKNFIFFKLQKKWQPIVCQTTGRG
jgi:hypothetical protein